MCNCIVIFDIFMLIELIRMDPYVNTVRPLIWVYHVMDFLNGYMNEGNAQVTNLNSPNLEFINYWLPKDISNWQHSVRLT